MISCHTHTCVNVLHDAIKINNLATSFVFRTVNNIPWQKSVAVFVTDLQYRYEFDRLRQVDG